MKRCLERVRIVGVPLVYRRCINWGVVGLLIVLRFSLSHTHAPTASAPGVSDLQGWGLYGTELGPSGPFRWTDGASRLLVAGTEYRGSLRLRAAFPPANSSPTSVRQNGRTASFQPSADIRTYTIFFPGGPGGMAPIEVANRSGASGSADSRRLGLALLALDWRSYDQPVSLRGLAALTSGLLACWLLAVLRVRWRTAAATTLDLLHGVFNHRAEEPRPLFRLTVLITLLLQLPLYNGVSERPDGYIGAFYFMALALLFLAISLGGRTASWLLLAGVVAMGVEVRIRWITTPTVCDVYWANMQAAQMLLDGRNPYSEIFTWVTVHPRYEWYGYLPFTIISQLPFFLLGNIRWGLALYDVGAIGLLFLLARRFLDADKAAALAAFLLLYAPLSEFTLSNGIVDPVMIFWILLSIYLLSRARWRWAAVAAGLALACKQYGAIYGLALVPYLLRRRQFGALGLLVAVPLVIIAPYVIWSPQDFLSDTLLVHTSFPPLAQPFAGVWNTSLPAQWVGLTQRTSADALRSTKQVASALALALMTLIGLRHLWNPTLKEVQGTTISVLCVLFLWNGALTQSFYWRTIVLLLAAWVCFWRESEDDGAHLATALCG